jgi:hypothetical protein
MTDLPFINRCRWTCVVADEAHRLKNSKTKVFEKMTSLECKHRVALTGTPLQNNFDELWSVPAPFFLGAATFLSTSPGASRTGRAPTCWDPKRSSIRNSGKQYKKE